MTHDAGQSAEDYNSAGIAGVSYPDALMMHSFASLPQTSALSDQLTGSISNLQLVASNESKGEHHLEVSYNSEAEEVHPAHLVKHGGILLERLKTLEWYQEQMLYLQSLFIGHYFFDLVFYGILIDDHRQKYIYFLIACN